MPYTISKKGGFDASYYGYETQYSIDFTFQKQKANVTIDIWPDEPVSRCRLVSHTDGYHWLHFFLSQEPDTTKMIEYDFKIRAIVLQRLFGRFGIDYEQEDKESAWLDYGKPIDDYFVRIVANIIEPLFANRERFFDD